jgi:hypothetical protein
MYHQDYSVVLKLGLNQYPDACKTPEETIPDELVLPSSYQYKLAIPCGRKFGRRTDPAPVYILCATYVV